MEHVMVYTILKCTMIYVEIEVIYYFIKHNLKKVDTIKFTINRLFNNTLSCNLLFT